MNRSYKVIWNESLNCFMAVAEYAKARGKSSHSSVSSNSVASEATNSGAKLLRLTAICAGIAASGFSMQAIADDGNFDNVTANGNVTATGNVTGASITASGMVNANGGLTVAGGQMVNMSGNKVTNVANGTATTDAVNFGQLEAVKTTASQGFNIQANSGVAEQIGPGETVTFQDGDSNIKITRTGNTISIATSANPNFTTVTTTGNITVGGTLNANGGLTVASNKAVNMGGNKVTNVADGTVVTDAVNFGQLDAVRTTANQGWNIRANGGPTQTIAPGDTVNFTNGNNVVISRSGNAISIATSPNPNFTTVTTTGNITVGGTLNANGGLTVASNKAVNMGGNKVTNVANGTIAENGKDAATTGQLWRLTEGGDGVKYFHANSEQPDSEAIGQESVAIGPKTKAEGVSGLAAGDSASVTAQGEGAIALGQNAIAGGAAPGSGGAGAVAVGRNSVASGSSTTALGDGAQARGGNATALGKGAQANGGNSIALGQSTASASNAFAAGNGAVANVSDGISIGTGAGVGTTSTVGNDQRDNIAIGRQSGQNVGAKESIGIGFEAGSNVKGDNNTAIGTQAGMGVTGEYNISMGYQANKNAGVLDHSTVVGSKANAGSNSVALGYEAQASSTDAVAVGSGAISDAQGLALGANSKSEANNIALGFNSKALVSDSTNSSYLTGNVSGQGVVSVGSTSANIKRRIVNVADGANGTDAVNVNQLKGAQQSVANLVGGSVPLNADGSYGKITVNNIGGGTTEFDTVVDAIGAITSGTVSILPAEAAKYNSDGTLDVAAGTMNGQAVNLGQLNTAIAENGIQYFSVNSTEGANRNNGGAAGTSAIAIGPEASASADESLALGHKARADADVSIAIGNNVRAEGKRSTVLGNESRVYDANGVAIGYEAVSNGENSLVMGTGAESNEKTTGEGVDNAIVIGTEARSTASNDGIAIGRTALAREERAVAQGFNAQSTAVDAIALGSRSRASGISSQASGTDARASGGNAQASGTSANASGTNAQASGTNASASGSSAMAQGTRATSYATDGIAMGTGAISGFEDPTNQDPQRNMAGIAIGKSSLADEKNALALGVEANARAQSATAVGDGANASGINALAIGTGAAANKQDATAIGNGASASAQNATAFGRGAAASAQDAIAFGREAQAVAQGAIALGQGAKANTNVNDVALGTGSVTGAVVNTPNATIDKNTYTYAGTSATSTLSVGAVGKERTITNVAAGRVSATSTDAINGSQLHGTNQAVTALGNNLDTAGQSVANALGGSSAYNSTTHQVNASLNVNGNTYTTVESAIKYAAQGWNVQTNSDTASNVAPGSTVQFKDGKNIKITRNGKDITVATADDVTFTKVTSGSMTVNNTDSIANGSTKNYVTQGSTSVVNGGDVYTAINTTNQQYQGDNGAVVTRNPNQVLKVKGGATTGTENNIQTVSNDTDGSISVKLAEKIDLGTDGRVKIGSTTVNDTGVTIVGGPSVTSTGINASDKVITGVANGSVTAGSKEAVNGGQLSSAAAAAKTEVVAGTNVAGVTKSTGGNGQDIYTINAKGASTTAGSSAVTVTNTTDANTNVTNAAVDLSADSKASLAKADNSVQYDNAGKTSVTLGGSGASPVKITNVADGTLSTSSKDAVNGSQLHTTNQNVTKNAGDITTLQGGFTLNSNGANGAAIKAGDTIDIGTANGETNLTVNKSGKTIDFALNKNLDLGASGSVTTGATTVNDNGIIITKAAGAPAGITNVSLTNTGLDNGGSKITNVAAGTIGTGSTDAVNGGQIQAAGDSLATNVLGGNAEYVNNSFTMSDVGGTGENNINDAIASANTAANAGWNVSGSGANEVNIGPNGKVDFVGDSNITVAQTGLEDDGKIGITLNPDLDVDSVKTGNSKLDNSGLSVTNGTYTSSVGATQIVAGGVNPVTVNGATGTVNGLTNKTFDPTSFTSGQAATEDQLKSVSDVANTGWDVKVNGIASDNVAPGETVQFVDGKNIKVTRDNDQVIKVATSDEVEFTKVTLGDATNNTILTSNANGLDVGGDKITNVAAGTIGTGSTDAVNGGQIQAAGDSLATNVLGGNAEYVNNSFTMSDVGGTGENNINDAIASANTAANAGWNVSGSGANEVNIGPNGKVDFVGDSNITVAQTGLEDDGKIGITLNPDLDVDSVKTGNSKLDNSGLSVTNGTYTSSVGATQIVAGGVNPVTVNGATGTVNGLTNKTFDPTSFTSGQAATEDQLKSVSDVANTGWDVKVNGIASDNVAPGETVQFVDGKNIKVTRDNDQVIKVATSDEVEFTKVTLGDATNNTILTSNANGLDVGGDKITNVAAGTIGTGSTDAVNGGQIQAAGDSLATNVLGGNAEYVNNSFTMSDVGGTGENNINDAIASANTAANAGWNVSGSGANEVNIGPNGKVDFVGDSNITVAQTGLEDDGKIGITLNPDLDVDSVKTGNSKLDNSGLSVTNGTYTSSVGATQIVAGGVNPVTVNGATGTVNGLTNKTFDPTSFTSGQAATEDQLKSVSDVANTGWDVKVNGIASDNVAPGETVQFVDGKNIKVTRDNDQVIKVATSDEVEFTKVTLGDATNNTILTSNANGLDVGGDKITNVAAGTIGTGSTDAVNGGQIQAAGDSLATNVLGGNAEYVNNSFTMSDVGGTGENNINDAIASANTAANAGWNVSGSGANEVNIGPNGKVDFVGDSNITVAQTGLEDDGKIGITLNPDLDVDSVKTGNSKLDNSGLSVTNGTYTSSVGATQIVAGGVNPVTVNGATGTVNGLTNKTFDPTSFTSGQAATEDQLKSVSDVANTGWDVKVNGIASDNVAPGETVQFVDGKNIKVTRDNDQVIKVATSDEVEFTKVTLGDATNNTILTSNANGLDVGGDKITNVAAGTIGTGSTDAVNGGQIQAAGDSLATNVLGGNAEYVNNSFTMSDVGGTGENNINDAIASANTAANAGWNVSGSGANEVNIGPNGKVDFVGDSNITVAQTGLEDDGKIGITLNPDLDVDSVKTGNSKLDNSGLSVTNGTYTSSVGATQIVAGGVNPVTVNGATGTVNGLTNKTFDPTSFTSGQAATEDQLKSVSDVANTGWDVKVNGIASDNVAPGETVQFVDGKNIKVTRDNDQVIKVATSDEVEFTKVTLGDATNNTILTSNANGLDVGGDKITNVAAGTIGTGSTDAVNGGQIQAAGDSLATNVLGGNAEYVNNSFTMSDVGGTGENNINDAIASANTAANAGWNVSGSGANEVNIGPNGKVDFVGDSNITVAQTGLEDDGKIGITLNPDLDVDSVKTGNSKLDNSGLSVNDGAGNLITVTNDGLTVTGGPSVTKSGIDAGGKVITGVASGVGSDTNAANIGDLKDAVTSVTNAGLSFKGDRGIAVNRKLGETLNITGGAATGAALTTGNIGIRNDGSEGLIVEIAEKVDLGIDGSVKTGVTIIDNTGLTIVGGPSVTQSGIDAGGKVIIGVADGLVATGSKEAINGGQLFGTANSVANNFGGGSKMNDNGTISAPKYELNDGVDIYDNVGDALGGLDDRVSANADNITNITNGTAGIVRQDPTTEDITVGSQTGGNSVDFSGIDGNRVLTGVADGKVELESKDAVNGGQLHNLGSDVAGIIGGDATYDANGNLTANNIGGTGKGNINDAIASINQGNAQANEDIKVNADNIQANTDRLDSGLSFGADTGDNINKPIGDSSALKFEGSDNITTSATGNSIKFDLNGNISVDSVTADNVTTGNTTVNTNGITIKDGPSMTTDGINAGDKAITGVADGIEVNDAVNFGQLNALDGKLSNSVNELGYKINEVEDDANAGISAAMAMSSLPQAYIPGKSMVGGGIATYNGQSAVAIGVSKVSDNGRWVIKVNGTADTQGNAGGAVGAGFHF